MLNWWIYSFVCDFSWFFYNGVKFNCEWMFDIIGILSEINIVKFKEKRWNCDFCLIVYSMVFDVIIRSVLMLWFFWVIEILCNICIWWYKCWRMILFFKVNYIVNVFRIGIIFKKILCI